MYLAYDGIVFDVLLLNGWDTNAMWSDDGADFLYWHHLIDVTVILNPGIVTAVNMPRVRTAGVNSVLKARQREQERFLRSRDNQAKMQGQLGPHGRVPGQPTRTDTAVPADWAMMGQYTDVRDYGFYIDENGDNSQAAAPGAPSYPPVSSMGPGLAYASDLRPKTGPTQEAGVSNLVEYSPYGALVSPGTVEDTTTGQFGSNPVAQFKFAPFKPPNGQQNQPGNPPRGVQPPEPGRRQQFPGNPGLPNTDLELRDRLQVPRRQLKVWVNTGPGGAPEYFLDLPYENCITDAKDGPRCVDQHMVAVHGNVTGVKRLVFECYEALPLFYGEGKTTLRSPNGPIDTGIKAGGAGARGRPVLNPPLISNRWTMRQMPDPKTFLNSTAIEGKAVFRLDVLSRLGMTADQLRKYIMPPLAAGYVRRPPEVTLGSEGNEVIYTIVDDQQMMNNPAGLRWGVHDVYIVDSMTANNPLDMVFSNARRDAPG